MPAQSPLNIPMLIQLQLDTGSLSAVLRQISSANTTFGPRVDPASSAGIASLSRSLGAAQAAFNGTNGAALQAGSSVQAMGRIAFDASGLFENLAAQAGLAARRIIGFGAASVATYKIAAGLKEAVSEAIAFERVMVKITQISTESSAEIRAIATDVGRLSTSLGVSSHDLVNVAEQLKQTGLSARETREALAVLAEVSLLPSFGDMTRTTQGAIAAMRQFGLETRDLRTAMGSINEVASNFAVESDDIIEAVKRAGGSFRAAGGDLNQFIALFTSVRATTRESAESIATGMRTIFGRLQRSDTVESLRALGINLRYNRQEAEALGRTDLTNQFVGAYEAVRRLNEGLSGLRATDPRYAQVIERLGGQREIGRIIPLIQEFGTAQRAANVAQSGSLSVTLAAERAQGTLGNQIDRTREVWLQLARDVVGSTAFQTLAKDALYLGESLGTLIGYLKPLLPLLTSLAAVKIGQAISSFVTGRGGAITSFASSFSSTVGAPIQPVRRAGGGYIPGTGNTDTVPALLTPNEYVLPVWMARQIGYDRLESVRQGGPGGTQRFAAGGMARAANPATALRREFLRLADTQRMEYPDLGNFKVDDDPNELLGRIGPGRALALAGVLPGSRGSVFGLGDGSITVEATGQDKSHELKRSIFPDRSGRLSVFNDSLDVDQSRQRSGIASRIYLRQLEAASREGVDSIDLHAAKSSQPSGKVAGYKVWPTKFGVDGPIKNPAGIFLDLRARLQTDPILEQYRDYLLDSKSPTVQGFLQLPRGEEFWAAHGQAFDGTLDLQHPRTWQHGLTRLRSNIAAGRPFARGGPVQRFADGGPVGPKSLHDYLGETFEPANVTKFGSLFKVKTGDRGIGIKWRGGEKPSMDLAFFWGSEIPQGDAADPAYLTAQKQVQPGSLAFARHLRGIVNWAQTNGVGINFDAEPRRGGLYKAFLEQAGFAQSGPGSFRPKGFAGGGRVDQAGRAPYRQGFEGGGRAKKKRVPKPPPEQPLTPEQYERLVNENYQELQQTFAKRPIEGAAARVYEPDDLLQRALLKARTSFDVARADDPADLGGLFQAHVVQTAFGNPKVKNFRGDIHEIRRKEANRREQLIGDRNFTADRRRTSSEYSPGQLRAAAEILAQNSDPELGPANEFGNAQRAIEARKVAPDLRAAFFGNEPPRKPPTVSTFGFADEEPPPRRGSPFDAIVNQSAQQQAEREREAAATAASLTAGTRRQPPVERSDPDAFHYIVNTIPFEDEKQPRVKRLVNQGGRYVGRGRNVAPYNLDPLGYQPPAGPPTPTPFDEVVSQSSLLQAERDRDADAAAAGLADAGRTAGNVLPVRSRRRPPSAERVVDQGGRYIGGVANVSPFPIGPARGPIPTPSPPLRPEEERSQEQYQNQVLRNATRAARRENGELTDPLELRNRLRTGGVTLREEYNARLNQQELRRIQRQFDRGNAREGRIFQAQLSPAIKIAEDFARPDRLGRTGEGRILDRGFAIQAGVTDPLEVRQLAVQGQLSEDQLIEFRNRGTVSPAQYTQIRRAAGFSATSIPTPPRATPAYRDENDFTQYPSAVPVSRAGKRVRPDRARVKAQLAGDYYDPDEPDRLPPRQVGGTKDDLGGLIRQRAASQSQEAFTARGGAHRLSNQTKGGIETDSLIEQESRARREFISAQKNLIRATEKGISSKELSRIAEEDYNRAVHGEVRVIRDRQGGGILGTEDRVRLATNATNAAGVTTPISAPGAGGLGYTVGERVRGVGRSISGFLARNVGEDSRANQRVARLGERLGGRAALNTALFLLPAVSGVVDHFAGTATEAVAGGAAGESNYRRLRGGSGALQGAVVGATLGSVVPGVGTAIGTAAGAGIGALTGLVLAIREASNEIRDVRIGNALADFTDRINAVASYVPDIGSRAVTDPAALSAAQSQFGRYQEESSARNEAQATSFFGVFNPTQFTSLQQRSARQDLGPRVASFNQVLSRETELLGRNNPTTAPGRLIEQLQAGNGGLNNSLITSVASARGVGVPEIVRELRVTLQHAQQARLVEQRNLASRTDEERNVNSFGRLVGSLEAAADSLRTLQVRSQTLAETFDGTVNAIHVQSNVDSLQSLGRRDSAALQPLSLLRDVGGEQGQNLFQSGQALVQVQQLLPEVLGQVARENPREGTDIVTGVQERLTSRLGDDPAVQSVIRTIVSQVDRYVAGEHGTQNFREGVQIDATKLAEQFVGPVSEPLRESATRAARVLEQESNRFVDGLTVLRRQIATVGETRDRSVGLRVASYRQDVELDYTRAGRRNQAADFLNLNTLELPFEARQRRLTGLGNNASRPNAIGSALERNDALIPGAIAARDAAQGTPAFAGLAQEATRLLDRSSNLRQALGHLANASERNAAIQERLNRIQQEREARTGLGEQYASSDAEGRLRIQRGFLLANQAQQQGSIDHFAPQDQRLIVETLRSAGNATLSGVNGSPRANDLLQALIGGSFNGAFNLTGGQQAEEGQLQNLVSQRMADAATAMDNLAQTQERGAADFFRNLREQQQQFFATFAQMLARDRSNTVQNQIATVQGQQGTQRQQSTQRDLLASVGVTTDEQLNALRNNRGSVTGLASSMQAIRLQEQVARTVSGEVTPDLFTGQSNTFTRLHLDRANSQQISNFLQGRGVNAEDQGRVVSAVDTRLGLDYARGGFSNRTLGGGAITPEQLATVVREATVGVLLDRSPNTAFGRAVESGDRAATQLGGIQGLDVQALSAILGGDQRENFVTALDAFQGTGQNLQGLNTRIQASAAEFERLNTILRELAVPAAGAAPAPAAGAAGPEIFARGGPVYLAAGGFQPRGTDTVAAMLTPREYVVNATSAQANLGLLNHINRSAGPVYLAGGGSAELFATLDAPRQARNAFLNQPQLFRGNVNANGFDEAGMAQRQATANRAAVSQYYGTQQGNLAGRQALANASDPFAGFGAGRADFQGSLSVAQRVNAVGYDYSTFRSSPGVSNILAQNVNGQSLAFASGGMVPNMPMQYLATGGPVAAGSAAPTSITLRADAAQSLNSFATVGSQLSPSLLSFAQTSEQMTQAMTSWTGAANALTQALTQMPRTLNGNFQHQVTLLHNGAEVFASLTPAVAELVELRVKAALQQIFNQQLPDAGVQIG